MVPLPPPISDQGQKEQAMEASSQIAFDGVNNDDAGGALDLSESSDMFAVAGSNSDGDVFGEGGMLD